MLNFLILRPMSTAANVLRSGLCKPCCGKNLRGENDESTNHHRLSFASSFLCYLVVFSNRDAGANAFPFAFAAAVHHLARNQTGQPERRSESICSSTGAAPTGWNDGITSQRSARQT